MSKTNDNKIKASCLGIIIVISISSLSYLLLNYGLNKFNNISLEIVQGIVDEINKYGFSRKFCESYFISISNEHYTRLEEWRANRYLFTDKDIELESLDNPKMIEQINIIYLLGQEGKISFKECYKQLVLFFMKRGYSENFIKFSLKSLLDVLNNEDKK